MKLAIFDMDGTLFNTNDVNYYSYKEALASVGVEIDYEYYCSFCNGRHYKVFVPQLVNNDEEKIEIVHNLKKELYKKNLDKVVVNKHLFEIIKGLKNKYKLAVVTTASKKNTQEILEFTDTQKYFDLILTSNDITKQKPDPEGFLLAMKNFNAKAEETLIFEDSDVGLEAAKKTGATVFKVEEFKD